MDSDIDDDAVLLDSALNGVSSRDLNYLIKEFGIELPPVKTGTQPSFRRQYQRHVATEQKGKNVMTTSKDIQRPQSNSDHAKVPEQDCTSESSIDKLRRNVSSDGAHNGCERSNCASCDKPKPNRKVYGIKMCSNCIMFIYLMAKQEFKTNCVAGQNNCRTTYSYGDPILCQSCRLRNMMKLDIQHPDWIKYKAKHGINIEICDNSRPQEKSIRLDDDNEDRESMTSGHDNSSSEEISYSEPIVHEQQGRVTQSHHGKSEKFKCASCGASNKHKYNGINLCYACQQFIFKIAKKKFNVSCIMGSGNCRITYKTGDRIRCQSCRLKRMMKLDIQHSAWVRYKETNRFKVADNSTREDIANMSMQPRSSVHDEDRESTTSSNSDGEESTNNEPKHESDTDEHRRSKTSINCTQSWRERNKCTGCSVPNRFKRYGINLCSGCIKFVSKMSNKNFKAICLGGRSDCRTTYKPGGAIRCASCRLYKLMKLEIRHPEWIKYKEKHMCAAVTTMRQDDANVLKEPYNSDDDDDKQSTTSSDSNLTSEEYVSSKSSVDEQEESTALSESTNCASCNSTRGHKYYGTNLCWACQKFVVQKSKKNFKLNCITGLGNCRTTYKRGDPIRCQSCRIMRMMKLDIRHPSWVRYKTELSIKSETFEEPSRQNDKLVSDDDDDNDNESMLSSGDNPSDKQYSSSESSTDGQKRTSTSPIHDHNVREQSNCVGCGNPNISSKLYNMDLCAGCKKFIVIMGQKNFKVNCYGGQDNCGVTYTPGKKIKCQSCRLKRLLKLDIRHPAWINYKSEQSIKSETFDNITPHIEELRSSDDNADRESMMSSHDKCSIGEYSSQKSSIRGRDVIVRLPNHGQSRCEQNKCAGCAMPSKSRYRGVNLCLGCQAFILKLAKENFNVHCTTGLGNCRTTYKAGHRIRCQSCRLKSMIRLDIRHPAWIEYKTTHERKIAANFTPQDGSDLLNEPHDSNDIEDTDSVTSNLSNSSNENSTRPVSNIHERKEDVASSDHDLIAYDQSECVSCYAPNELIFYGMNLCYACQKFIYQQAKNKFKVICIGGQDTCRTTHTPGYKITCQSCRLKRLMALDIRHPAWIKYKAEQSKSETFNDSTPHDEELLSSDDNNEDQGSTTSSSNKSIIQDVDEYLVQVASKPLIGPNEDCDADDEIEVMEDLQ